MKCIVFCLGSKEEVLELFGFILDLKRNGHLVAVVTDDGLEPFSVSEPSLRPYTESELKDTLLDELRIDALVIGNQSGFGQELLAHRCEEGGSARNMPPTRLLYQGRYRDARPWTQIHELLTHVWALNEEALAGWDDLEHDPWLKHGDGDDFSFYEMLCALLQDD